MARRPQPRRRYYAPESSPPVSAFSIDRLLNLGATPLITAAIAGIGFYYTTNGTLVQQSDQIKQANAQIEKANAKIEIVTKQVLEKGETDNAQREKIRESFLTSQTKTNEGIAKLDTRLAVAETQQNITNSQLAKIADTLDKISNLAIGGAKK